MHRDHFYCTYIAQCPDQADVYRVVQPTGESSPDYFYCLDGKKSIPVSLVCDGYWQCDDKSDEAVCKKCPPVLPPDIIFNVSTKSAGTLEHFEQTLVFTRKDVKARFRKCWHR